MKVLNDLLWDGDLKIFQDSESFKFSLDSVLLANFVTINQSIKNILDIGTGNAPIPLMLSKRTKAMITGIEIQEESYKLAKESVEYNKLSSQIELKCGDINKVYLDLNNNYFDTIVCNPPYYKNNMVISNIENKKIARSESNLNLENLFLISKKLLKSNGNIALVIDSNRLVEVFDLMRKSNIEPKKVQFVYPKIDKISNIVLIEGTKNGKKGLKVLNPVILQNSDNSYTKFVENMLKNFGKY